MFAGFTLDVELPVKVERDQLALEVVPSGFFYVGYYNGDLLRFTEEQYREALVKGSEFATDVITRPNVFKSKVVMNGFSIDHEPGDMILIENDGENYYLRVVRSPSLKLTQPIGDVYPFDTVFNIVFTPDEGFDFNYELEVLVNGEVVETLLAPPYATQWTPSLAGTYTIMGRFNASGMPETTNASVVRVEAPTAPPIEIVSDLTVFPQSLMVGEIGTATITVDDPDNVASTQFFVDGIENIGSLDLYSMDYVFDTEGNKEIYAVVTAIDGGTFDTPTRTVEVRPVPTYTLPPVTFKAEVQTDEFLAKVVDDNSARSNGPEGLAQLFDDNSNTKWLQFLKGKYSTTFDFIWPNIVTISGVTMTSAGDAAYRDPIKMTVINGDTGEEFEIPLLPIRGPRKTTYTFMFPEPVITGTLRIIPSTNDYGHSMQLAELSFVYN